MSAFSTWDKELHKIVFDPRYLLLNPKERKQVQFLSVPSPLLLITFKLYMCLFFFSVIVLCLRPLQVFDQYVKTRAEEERKEKKNKLMQAKDEFRRMMEDAKLGPR